MPGIRYHFHALIMPLIVSRGQVTEKDCCRGNERLGAKAHAACFVAEGDMGRSEIPPDLSACVSLSKCPES